MSEHGPVRIREVRDDHALDAFLTLPWRLYVDDPAWVRPLPVLDRRRLSASGPLRQRGDLRLYLAEREGAVVGRVSVHRERHHEEHTGETVAFFGYFETVDDPSVAGALLDRAAEQARQWGAVALRGPQNLDRLMYIGITVEGHHRRPPMLQAHHPPWYAERVEEQGFAKHHDMIAYEVDLVDARGGLVPIPDRLLDKARAASRDLPGLEVRRARWRRIGRDLDATYELFNATYLSVPDAEPFPRGRFVTLGRAALAVANTELLQLAFVDGEPAGFAVCLPEINEALAASRGSLLPLGWLRVALAGPQIRTAGFKLIGVREAYRGSGLHALLIKHVIEGCRRAGYTRLDASVINEKNEPMRAVVEGAGCTPYRRWRVYERSLEA